MGRTSTSTKTLRELVEAIDDNRLVLPEIQREFVWNKRSVKLLFDSLFRQLPVGNFLVWKATTSVEQRTFAGGKKLGNPALIDNFYGYLLDGQQRLTALMRVRDASEEFPLFFYAWPKREAEGDEHFYYEKASQGHDPWMIHMADVLSGRFSIPEHMRAIEQDPSFERGMESAIHADLVRLQGILDGTIGVMEFESGDYREATELFIRFNSTGKRLGKDDLFTAELALKARGLVRDELSPASQRFAGFRFTIPFLVRCLIAVHGGRLNTKASEAFIGGNDKALRGAWQRTERGLAEVVKLVTGVVRWSHLSMVPSVNALLPLIAIAAHTKGFTQRDGRLARRWLLLAGFHRLFSGSVYTEIDRILRRMGDEPSVDALWDATKSKLPRLKPIDFDSSPTSGGVMSLFVAMLRDSDARDWCNPDLRLDGSLVGHNAKLQVHHFFPRALLRKHGWDRQWTNNIWNYTVISAGCNLHVGEEEPATYLPRLNLDPKVLEDQCIPADPDLWRVANYERFADKRQELLAERANTFLFG